MASHTELTYSYYRRFGMRIFPLQVNNTCDEAERNMTVVLIRMDVSGYVVAEREVCCEEMANQSPQTLFDCLRQGTLCNQTTQRSAYVICMLFSTTYGLL